MPARSGCATGAAGGEVVPPLVATPRAWQARLSRAARDGEPLVKANSPDQNESGWRACPPVEGPWPTLGQAGSTLAELGQAPTVWMQFFHSF
ncbi:MAG: hypothetical protein HYV36_03610 [Lentisphaerae bacterium]|nr:hypothetical protein [Lentisphaerota bacterium]